MSTLVSQVLRDYYTYAEAAQVIGITKVTLWRWIKAGKIPIHRLGREVLIEKKVVDRLRKSG